MTNDNASEDWTVYDSASGAIRLSGHGPRGSGAMQRLRAGETLTLQASDPNRNVVDTSGPHPVIVPNPHYEP